MIYFFLAFCAGLAVTFQTGVNTQLRSALQNPVAASLASFTVGTLVLFLCMYFYNGPLPSLASLSLVSWWKWTGGILGAFFVYAVIVLTPEIGPANMLSLVVFGQLFLALLLEHFGLLGFTLHPVSPLRLGGLVLLVAGVYLIQKY
ncbi:putative membrane protein [Propionispora sp. 2/2-37]|uniref:DMT family transporter n=1 Tax=Propionispora sp. 2/2-37 TaxID=1677858 RepID=UPI0006BB948D|nr:DMT family transporter [Propionispora sp. 2/2-37]CUH96353.1 putative membrane protein [Propionispora sp. 2/2-37]